MKKRFLSKSLIAKIALVLVIILLFEFSFSEPVSADVGALGGQLLNPIINLVVYLADGVINILQSALTNIDDSFTYIDITKDKTSWWFAVKAVVVGVVLVVGAIAVTIFTGGAAAPAIVATVAGYVAGAGIGIAAGGAIYLAVYPQFGEKINAVVFGNSFVYPTIYITPETILKNQISLFDVNYFKKETYSQTQQNEQINKYIEYLNEHSIGYPQMLKQKMIEKYKKTLTDQTGNLSTKLREVISQVYTTIRDVALVAMLIVIIYVAIRMLLALTPKEKSRYKESAVNCVIGLVLILIMHFIMSASVTLLEMITNSITLTNNVYDISEDEVNNLLNSDSDAYDNAISGVMLEIAGEQLYNKVKDPDADDSNPEPPAIYSGMKLVNNGKEKITYVKASNFTEQARYMAQKLYTLDDDNNTVETWEHIGWAFVYIMLVVLTLAFVVMYAKRTLYMAALTMFAPVVGVMYPINRVNGSRAHTLNLWFREYMGNLIIQPFHLLLYTIFIGSAMAMAIHNPVYVIIAIMGLMFVEKLLKDLLGIQDTRIGSLGKSLQDTTRAIKTTEKAATSIAKTVGRTASKATHAIGNAAVGLAASKGRQAEGEEENNTNSTPRVQQNPQNAEIGKEGGELPPPTAGAQNPQSQDEGLDNGARQPREQKAERKKLDEVATMDKYFSEGGKQNSDGEYFNPYTDEFDPNYNPLTDPLFQVNSKVNKEVDEAATMQKYMSEGGRQNAYGEYYDLDRDEFDANYNPLTDSAFQVYSNENTGIGSGTGSASSLDEDTLSLVDDYNNAVRPFSVINGTGGDVGDVLRTDGYRDMLETDNDKLVRMETRDMPDDRNPMASALSPAAGAENINISTNGIDNLGTIENTETARENGRTTTSSSYSSSNSGITSFNIPSGSQNIPDGNNLRTEVIDFESKAQARGENRISTGEDAPSNNNTIDSESKAQERRENVGASSARPRVNSAPQNNSRIPAPSDNNTSQNNDRTNIRTNNNPEPAPSNNGNPAPANNNAPQNNSRTNAGGQTNNGRSPEPTNNNAPQNNNATNAGTQTNNTTNSTQDDSRAYAGTNLDPNNNGKYASEHVNDGAPITAEDVARKVEKGMNVAGTVGSKAAGVVGSVVDGVIDTALAGVSGDLGGVADAVLGTATDSLNIVTGGTSRGSSSSGKPQTAQKAPVQKEEKIIEDARIVQQKTQWTTSEANAFARNCKNKGIPDDRNIGEVGIVYKKASESEKPYIIELSKILYESKRNGKSFDDAKSVLERAGMKSSTMDAFKKMYDNLIAS